LPHAPVPARLLIPGAVSWAVGADLPNLPTTYWLGNLVARKTSTYGAVGIALAVLLWVYVLGRIMVGSAGLKAPPYYRRENRAGQAGRAQLTGGLSGGQPAPAPTALPPPTGYSKNGKAHRRTPSTDQTRLPP